MITRHNRHGVAHSVDTARHASAADMHRQNHRPPRRRVDWTEVGWRVAPYAAALICALGLYFGGGPT